MKELKHTLSSFFVVLSIVKNDIGEIELKRVKSIYFNGGESL